MRIITSQYHVSIPLVMKKLGKEHRIAINLVSPFLGICVDGHHDYIASMMDHKPLRIVIASMGVSDNLTGESLLDFYNKRKDPFDKIEGWQFYDLMTGKAVAEKELRKVVDEYPDYRYSV